MKGMDIFCSSPASTAVICSSLDRRSMVRHGTRPFDRSNSKPYVPCTSSSQLPFDPKSLYDKTRKSFSQESGAYRKSSADITESASTKRSDFRRRSSANVSDLHSPSSRYLLSDRPYVDWISEVDQCATTLVPINETTKPGHKPWLVSGSPGRKSSSLGWVSESGQVSTLVSKPRVCKVRDTRSIEYAPARLSSSLVSSQELISKPGYVSSLIPPTQNSKLRRVVNANDSAALKCSSSARSRNQVVVLRVSIHCKGCEGKVRKHISRMEGVTSFSIDLETKKVTVIGDVTPLGVLASISKVKNAQLWPSSTTTSSTYDHPTTSPRWST